MPDVIHLSSVAGSPLLDSDGQRLGRVEDLIVRLDHGQGLPPVTGLKARIGGREMFVPIDLVQLGPDAVRSSTTKLDLGQFERRPGELLLRSDVLDREHQVNCQRYRTDTEAAGVLTRMASDDAADLLLELDQERRLPILNLLPAVKQRKIRTLLGHNPSTAGGLMNPDFVSVSGEA